MKNSFIFFTVLFFFNCKSRLDKVDTFFDSSKIVVNDSSNKIISGKILFQVAVRDFFKEGAINDIGYGETSLRYLIPLSFYKDKEFFYIPDRSKLSLNILNPQGQISGSVKLPLKDFVFYKIERFRSYWYLVDFDRGLTVLDAQLKTKFNDEKTTDFHVDKDLDNIYFENMMNDERALLDQNGILKSPLKIEYLSCFIENSTLFGISDRGDNHYTIMMKNLNDGSESEYLSFDTSCNECFIMPILLDKKYILSSTNTPSIMDQITVINSDSLSIANYSLEYPDKVNPIINDISVSISYSGYVYFYDSRSRILYSLCTDKTTIKVFSFDLNV